MSARARHKRSSQHGAGWAAPLVLLAGLTLHGQVPDDFDKFTSVGQLGIAVTNFGVLGNGYNKINNVIQSSARYKQHTQILREQVEHFSYAGLWVGGTVAGQPRVSTAIVDGVFESGAEGFEFTPLEPMVARSSISSTSQDPLAAFYSPSAISHQDYLTRYTDIFPVDVNIPNHTPLGIEVAQRSFSWNFSFADAFVIFEYTIHNKSNETISNLYAGLWLDVSIGNMNFTSEYEPGGGWDWYDNLDGFDRSVDIAGYERDMSYQYDEDGDDGWAESYFAVKTLGGTVPPPFLKSHFNQWVWTNTNNADYPNFSMALTDVERYRQLSNSVPPGVPDPALDPPLYLSDGYPARPNSWLFLHSAGPFGSVALTPDSLEWELLPGDSAQIVFAMVAARWADKGADSPARRSQLRVNADWAQKTYDGDDGNRNNMLDPGEDGNENGVLDRYIVPEPPPVPNMHVEIESQKAVIFWNRASEDFVDPISHEKDFEGYRVYGARKTRSDGSLQEFTLLGEFDLAGNDIGFDTGLDQVRLLNGAGEPDSVIIGGRSYHYSFENVGIKNGWLNYYAVTAFDHGDPATNLPSLESSPFANRQIIYPGTPAAWNENVGVYPNPYRGAALWDGFGSRERLIWFQYLPLKAEIRIYNLAGDLVQTIMHDLRDVAKYAGQDVRRINESLNPRFAGGEHAWDLITRHEQEAATGLYIYVVRNLDEESEYFGRAKEGSFLIIK